MVGSISRRAALKGIAVGALVPSGLGGLQTDPSEPPPEIGGVIQELMAPNQLLLKRTSDLVLVEFPEGAQFFRDRETELAAFRVGDEVAIVGGHLGEVFVGNYMMPIYRSVEGRITQRRADRLRVAGMTLQVIPETQPEEGGHLRSKPIQDLAEGDGIAAYGRVDPGSGYLVAMRIGVVVQ